MDNIEDVKRKIVDLVGHEIRGVHFVESTFNNRPWFFGGLSKVVEGDDVDEVNVSLEHGILVVNGRVTDSSKLIPHDTHNLFIYEPALRDSGVSVDNIVKSISYTLKEQNLIKEKRPFDLLECLLTSVNGTKTSEEFMREFIGKLVKDGEINLSSKKIPHMIKEIIRLLNLSNGDLNGTRAVNYIKSSRIVLEFYEGSGNLMSSTFPLTHKGLYGFAYMINMISKYNNFKI